MDDVGAFIGAASRRDVALVKKVAAELLTQFGLDLPEFLSDQIEIAQGRLDELSVRAWTDIRTAAEKMSQDACYKIADLD
jgi:hypothetical protein